VPAISGEKRSEGHPERRARWNSVHALPKLYAVIDESIVRSLAEVLGRTEGGLSNKQINELLAAARIPDPTPPAPPGTYVMISKRDRLFEAMAARQRRDGCGNAVLAFVAKALAPVRFHESPGAFEALRAEINVPLAFAGYHVDDAGKLHPRAAGNERLTRVLVDLWVVELRVPVDADDHRRLGRALLGRKRRERIALDVSPSHLG
jgi:hypothetical protein